MSTSPRGGGLRPFRLEEVPLGIRLRAADRLLTTEGSRDGTLVMTSGLADRLAIGVAAQNPSPRIYYVSRSAWARVMRGRP